MLYAVVDIETTGGYAASNGITEIAVFITDGMQVLDEYHTLLNPIYTIPRFIESLTGITNDMVADEPDFKSVSAELFDLLQDKIFVAHNVNFDYSFLKHHFHQAGFVLDTKKLCTIRLSRRIFPGLRGYGLDKICSHLDISITDRHRARGDAFATMSLLHRLIENDRSNVVAEMLKGNSKEHFLPPNLSVSDIRKLPRTPGVYYFLDKKGKVIYVGKAKNIFSRVNSHFANNKPNKQKQEFLKRIHHISFEETGTELMAIITESAEIKRIWPPYNTSQKRFQPAFALYDYTDQNGFRRLYIDKRNKRQLPIYTFYYQTEALNALRQGIRLFALCARLCFLQNDAHDCREVEDTACGGTCYDASQSAAYNLRVAEFIESLTENQPSFAIVDKGRKEDEQSCILVEKGRCYGTGFIPRDSVIQHVGSLKQFLTPLAENEFIRSVVIKYSVQYPHRIKIIQESILSENF